MAANPSYGFNTCDVNRCSTILPASSLHHYQQWISPESVHWSNGTNPQTCATVASTVLNSDKYYLQAHQDTSSATAKSTKEDTIQQQNEPSSPQATPDMSKLKASDSRVYRRLYKRKGVLNPIAVRIMTSWYVNNSEHPYPSYESAEIMAKAGDITVEQVKKWFANRRRRCNNTKPMKEIAERRKVLKRNRASIENDDILLSDAKRAREC